LLSQACGAVLSRLNRLEMIKPRLRFVRLLRRRLRLRQAKVGFAVDAIMVQPLLRLADVGVQTAISASTSSFLSTVMAFFLWK
jgi:hypothetical protein